MDVTKSNAHLANKWFYYCLKLDRAKCAGARSLLRKKRDEYRNLTMESYRKNKLK